MQNYTDEELIKLAAKDDQEAVEILVSRYLKLVYSFVYRYVHVKETAEDITQEVFVKVWRNLGKFDQARAFRPWLYQIAKNTCFDYLKKKSELSFSDVDLEVGSEWLAQSLLDTAPGPEILLDRSFLADKLGSAIEKLSPEYAKVIILYHGQALNFREIAEATGERINTVKSRYRRALILLKKIFKP